MDDKRLHRERWDSAALSGFRMLRLRGNSEAYSLEEFLFAIGYIAIVLAAVGSARIISALVSRLYR
jgi:hypothetical protein